MFKRDDPAKLPDDVVRFAQAQVATGRFATVDEVLRAVGIEALEQARGTDLDRKLAALDAALEEGERSGIAEDGVFARVRRRVGLSSDRR